MTLEQICTQYDDDQLLEMAIAEARVTPDETHDAILQLLGLIQSVAGRDDCPAEVKAALIRSQQYVDARAVAKAYL